MVHMLKRLIANIRSASRAARTTRPLEVHAVANLRPSTAQERCERRRRDNRTVTRTCSCCLLSYGDHQRCCGHRTANLFLDGR